MTPSPQTNRKMKVVARLGFPCEKCATAIDLHLVSLHCQVGPLKKRLEYHAGGGGTRLGTTIRRFDWHRVGFLGLYVVGHSSTYFIHPMVAFDVSLHLKAHGA